MKENDTKIKIKPTNSNYIESSNIKIKKLKDYEYEHKKQGESDQIIQLPNQKNFKIIIPIIIIGIILIIGIAILLVSFIRKNKKTNDIIEQKDENDSDNIKEKDEVIMPEVNSGVNYFMASYLSNGEELKIFNPSRIGLKGNDFTIDEIDYRSNGLRRIEEIDGNNTNLKNGVISPNHRGIVNLLINFTKPLNNMDYMFEGCDKLLSVDLSHIESPSLNSMIYTFANCKNLENVNLTSVNTSKVELMDFLFVGCSKLTNIDGFNELNTSSLKKTAGMFFGCNSLVTANLSSFNLDGIEEQSGMFVETNSLKEVDLGNCTDGNKIFDPSANYNLTIIANETINISLDKISGVSIGGGGLFGSYITCEKGPNEKCKECEKIRSSSNCKNCNEGYFLPLGGDEKKFCKKCNEGCLECYAEEGSNNSTCTSCDKGYYLDTENYDCKKIEIEGCVKSNELGDNMTCLNCSEGYELYGGECAKLCEKGENEKCVECNSSFENMYKCSSCNKGYILNNKMNDKICQSCGEIIDKCNECKRISGDIQCTSCIEGYKLFNNKCYKDCNDRCLECEYVEEGEGEDEIQYGKCRKCKEGYYLRQSLTYDDDGIYYQATFCNPCTSGCKKCTHDEFGGKTICSLCYDNYNLTDITCKRKCDFGINEKCLNCNGNQCASCNPGYYLDDGKCLSCGINNCEECDKNKICKICEKGYDLENNLCIKKCEVGDNEKCKTCNNIKIGECSECNLGYYLPDDVKDKTKCYQCGEGCLSCSGGECYSCDIGFKLTDNFKCEPKCKLGQGDLCLSCDYSMTGGENCAECNEGYYLPEKGEKTSCKKCGENMKKCHTEEENGEEIIVPDECFFPYKNSGNYCLNECIKGDNKKCFSCNDASGKIYQCRACNPGYYLPRDASDLDKKSCFKCDEGCETCEGTKENSICTKCSENYVLFEEKCVKKCEIGDYEKCKECKNTPGLNYQCNTCNDGFYLPYNNNNYNYSTCLECPKNCKSCSGEYSNPTCNECISNEFYIKNGICVKSAVCNNNDKCSQCNTIENSIFKECALCADGYYLPKNRKIDENYNKCYKCNIAGCKICEGNEEFSNKCLQCEDHLSNPLLDDNGSIISCYKECDIGPFEKCKSCNGDNKCLTCNKGYELKNGECVKEYYDFTAKYETVNENENIILMKDIKIIKMEIDGKIIENISNNYTFKNPGVHNVSVKLESAEVISLLFNNITGIKSITFWDNKNTAKVSLMNDLFSGCINLEYVDMSRLNWENNYCLMNMFKNNKKLKEIKFPKKESNKVYWFYGMFYGCESLEEIDMLYLSDSNGAYFQEMFKGCTKLKKINMYNFKKNCSNCEYENMFDDIPNNGSINVTSQFYIELIKKYANGWEIIKNKER